MRKSHVTFCLLFTTVLLVEEGHAISREYGRVSMQGAIVDAACTIEAGNREQSIDMGTLPLSQIVRDGYGAPTPIVIRLVNCTLSRADMTQPDWKKFRITFEGRSDGDFFGVQGGGSGVALKITDGEGRIATPGVPLPQGGAYPGEMQLDYVITPVANQRALTPGAYFSVVRFRLDYF